MPQSALSQVPGHSARPMVGTTGVGASAGTLFPCRVHLAQTDRIFGASERQNHLQHPVPRRRSNLAGNCRRSQTLRRIHRLPGGAPHLGSEPASEPSLMMPGIIISFIFIEQSRLTFCAVPLENQLAGPKEPLDDTADWLFIQISTMNCPRGAWSGLFALQ